MQEPKVLVAVPYHKTKEYCLPQLMKAIDSLSYKNKDVVMRFDLAEYGGDNNVKKQREYFRRLALAEGYDYLYFLGADTIPPSDVLERLVTIAQLKQIHIIGGVYWGRHNAENGRPEGAVAWINEMSQEDQTKAFRDAKRLITVDGMGMDCVLIHKEVLNRITWLDWQQNDDDYPFYDKARELGYKVVLDTSVQCKHYFSPTGYTYLAEVHNDL